MKLRDFCRPSLAHWLAWVAWDWAVILAAFAAFGATRSLWVLPFCVLAISTRQHALGILGHEAAHYLVCRNRNWNDFLGAILCMWPVGGNVTGYRKFHFEHHWKVGTPADPELQHKHAIRQWPEHISRARFVAYLVLDFFGGAVPHIVLAMYLLRRSAWWEKVGQAALFAGFFALSCWLGALWVPALWFGSLLTAFWAVFRLRMWTEHVGTTGAHKIAPTWWQRWLFLPHNTWCHHEHHCDPRIPFYRLELVRSLDRWDEISVSRLFGTYFS